jgi:hypothetical protein
MEVTGKYAAKMDEACTEWNYDTNGGETMNKVHKTSDSEF